MAGKLILCATPIGNLQDISLRALETLKQVPLIAAEDTRHTRKLLNHFGIKTSLTSYHQHNERSKAVDLVRHLQSGLDLALVSDAGLPGISDPGEVLVKMALAEGVQVDVIPGPNALISGLVISGLPSTPFYFAGFLPSTAGQRKEALRKLKNLPATLAFYEAPHRLGKFLRDVLDVMGNVEVAITRELTKLHQEVIKGKVSDVLELIERTPVKGELVVFIAPPVEEKLESPSDWTVEVNSLVKTGLDKKEAIKNLATKYKIPKREIYNYLVKMDYH